MKLFGKRKSKNSPVKPVDEGNQNEKEGQEEVTSYFSSDFKPLSSASSSSPKSQPCDVKKGSGNDIEELLKMDPSELNAKQRRIVRRHKERSGGSSVDADAPCTVKTSTCDDEDGDKKSEEISTDNDVIEAIQIVHKEDTQTSVDVVKDTENMIENEEDGQKESKLAASKSSTTIETVGKHSVAEIADQLKGLNSKERRKLLRRLASEAEENESINEILDQAIALSKKIAEENESKQVSKDTKKDDQKVKNIEDDPTGSLSDPSSEAKDDTSVKTTKKRKWKDFSHLSPEERERRETQRKMQQEAAARRASGEVLTRHPLNSERRRANRRKPGRAGKIAALKKAQREKQETLRMFNASGYSMRHTKKNISGSN